MPDYYADDRLSASKLKNYLSHDPAIAHYKEQHSGGGEQSDALRLGKALHSLMEFQTVSVIPYENFRSEEARQWRDEHPDALKTEEVDMVTAWHEAIEYHLERYHKDLNFAWRQGVYEDEFFTERYKAKIDCHSGQKILDWKTTRHTKADDVIREYQRYGAALQAAHYLNLANCQEFYFVVVSKTEPYPVWVIQCSKQTIDYGLQIRRQCEAIREKYLLQGSQDIITFDPPAWAQVEVNWDEA